MDFNVLEKELFDSGLCRILQNDVSDPEIFLNKLELHIPKNAFLSPNTLYICERLPEAIPDVDPFNFITFSPFTLPDDREMVYNGLYVDVDEKESLFSFLKVLFEDDNRLMHAIQPMLETLLKGYDLQQLNDAATQILGNPFWVTDMNFKFLTLPSAADTVLLESIKLGHVTNEIVHYITEMNIPEKVRRINEAFCFPASDSDKNIMIAAVKIQNIIVGYINLKEEHHAFSTYDFRLMNKIAEIISLELQKDSYYRVNKGISFSYFLTDLLNEQITDPEYITKRMHLLGYQSKKYFHIITTRVGSRDLREANAHFITEQIKFILKDCIYCNFKGNLVFLYTTNEELTEGGPLHRQLEQYFSGNNLTCGISERFSELSFMRRFYDQTLIAIELGQELMEDMHIHYYGQYIIYQLYKETHRSVSYSALCHHAVGTLSEYDSLYHTDLLHTLQLYFKCNLQIVKTSEVMGLHSNTLRYRIAKIKELTGLNLEDGDETLELMLSLKMYSFHKSEEMNR